MEIIETSVVEYKKEPTSGEDVDVYLKHMSNHVEELVRSNTIYIDSENYTVALKMLTSLNKEREGYENGIKTWYKKQVKETSDIKDRVLEIIKPLLHCSEAIKASLQDVRRNEILSILALASLPEDVIRSKWLEPRITMQYIQQEIDILRKERDDKALAEEALLKAEEDKAKAELDKGIILDSFIDSQVALAPTILCPLDYEHFKRDSDPITTLLPKILKHTEDLRARFLSIAKVILQEPTIEPTIEPTTEPTTEPTIEPTTEPTDNSDYTSIQTMYLKVRSSKKYLETKIKPLLYFSYITKEDINEL